MRDVAGRVRRLTRSWQLDAVVATALAVGVLAYQGVSGTRRGAEWAAPIAVLVWCGALAGRRRWPLAAAVVSSAAYAVLVHHG